MKNSGLIALLVSVFFVTALFSCSKTNEDFNPQGGLLPTNYIIIKDSSFSPAVLTIATGSSITFVNSTNADHSIVSSDSSTILTNTILPNSSYFFKKDTIGVISYHCGAHPTVSGTIILRP